MRINIRTILFVASFVLGSQGCTKSQAKPIPSPGVPVVTAKVSQRAMPVEITSVGNVEAISTIAIRSQVAGQLLEVHFREGDFVRKGQVLFTIDSRPYQSQVEQVQAVLARDQAQLRQAQANLGKDTAQAEYNKTQAARYAMLKEKGVLATETADQVQSQSNVSQETLHADQAAIESIRANLDADQANLNNANLQLSYCTIASPLDGRTGAITVKPGNLVKAADVPIVVINQVDPIYVNFTIPQQYWPQVRKFMAEGALHVRATAPETPADGLQGMVTFVDNAVDPATGTIHVKATFDNPQNRLWPGLFVNAVLQLSEDSHAIVVPSQAITAGQNGPFVYVVKGNHTVEARPVTSSRTIGGMAVIEAGLQPGEDVVADGQARLTAGAKVQVKATTNDEGKP